MKDTEREQLVADLAAYIHQMAPHQKARQGGLLILRSWGLLRRLRVQEMSPEAHAEKLLDAPRSAE